MDINNAKVFQSNTFLIYMLFDNTYTIFSIYTVASPGFGARGAQVEAPKSRRLRKYVWS